MLSIYIYLNCNKQKGPLTQIQINLSYLSVILCSLQLYSLYSLFKLPFIIFKLSFLSLRLHQMLFGVAWESIVEE